MTYLPAPLVISTREVNCIPLELKLYNIKFIDSHSLVMPISAMPKTLGLTELTSRTILYNTRANEHDENYDENRMPPVNGTGARNVFQRQVHGECELYHRRLVCWKGGHGEGVVSHTTRLQRRRKIGVLVKEGNEREPDIGDFVKKTSTLPRKSIFVTPSV